MQNTPIANAAPTSEIRKPSCSVCWQDFNQHSELDDHIRQGHPDRIIDPDDLIARAS